MTIVEIYEFLDDYYGTEADAMIAIAAKLREQEAALKELNRIADVREKMLSDSLWALEAANELVDFLDGVSVTWPKLKGFMRRYRAARDLCRW